MNEADIELSHLRYFVVMAEELHFARAAQRLHIAQPPLTRHMQLLEERLQCALFDRTPRTTRLTPAGALFADRARGILAEAGKTFEDLQKIGRGEEGRLIVATAPSLMLCALPNNIRAFRTKYPRVAFRLEEMASSVILKAVGAGAVDLGFVRGMDKAPDIETRFQWGEPMVAFVPRDNPLAKKPGIMVNQLRDENFVFFPRELGPSFYDEMVGFCQKSGFTPAVTQEARQWSSILSLVSAGMGVSVGPQSVAALLPKAVHVLRVKNMKTTVRVVGGRGSRSNAAVNNFLDVGGPLWRI